MLGMDRFSKSASWSSIREDQDKTPSAMKSVKTLVDQKLDEVMYPKKTLVIYW